MNSRAERVASSRAGEWPGELKEQEERSDTIAQPVISQKFMVTDPYHGRLPVGKRGGMCEGRTRRGCFFRRIFSFQSLRRGATFFV